MSEVARKNVHVFYISDQTGITALFLGRSLITQFRGRYAFTEEHISFVNNANKICEAVEKVARAVEEAEIIGAHRPIVISTFVDSSAPEKFMEVGAFVIEAFRDLTEILEKELGAPASHEAGLTQAMGERSMYQQHMEAVNFAVDHDDYKPGDEDIFETKKADLVIVGVSRSGKTPTAMFLATYFFLKVANYPLTLEADQKELSLNPKIAKYRRKIVGLTINPQELHRIRSERLPNLRYSSPEFCEREVRSAERLYREEGITVIDTTKLSALEIAVRIKNLNLGLGSPI